MVIGRFSKLLTKSVYIFLAIIVPEEATCRVVRRNAGLGIMPSRGYLYGGSSLVVHGFNFLAHNPCSALCTQSSA